MSVLEQVCDIVFRLHLSRQHCHGLPPGGITRSVPLEIICNLFDNPLEGNFADEEVGGLLQAPDLAEGNSAGSEAMGLPFAGSLCGPFLVVRRKFGARAWFRRAALLVLSYCIPSA